MSPDRPLLALTDVSVAWGRTPVVRGVSLEVRDGELLALLGPNGSGKSTLLRAIAGFRPLSGGTIALGGAPLAGVPPHRRSIGILFQEPTLFPKRSVWENVAYGPLLARRSDAEVREEVADLASLLELEPLLERAPGALSGGERQRVALARTLAARPRLVLLDEPFASVDPELRAGLHATFRRALAARRTAAIHVTHDRDEGLFLGDRVALLFDGRIEAVGPPSDVFAAPASARVARFLGYNVLDGPDGLRAVLPEEITLAAAAPSERAFRVVAHGVVGRLDRAILEGPGGERVEVRSPTPLAVDGRFAVGWSRSVPLPR